MLRRIMRRAMRHAQMIGCKEPLMHRLVPALVSEMGQAFPELARAEAMVAETLLLEEKRFRKTLDRGIRLLDEEVSSMNEGDVLKGAVAFKLYDTYGFPLDLTQDALRAKGLTVDENGFNAAMEKQIPFCRPVGFGHFGDGNIHYNIAQPVDMDKQEFLGQWQAVKLKTLT